MPSNLPWSVHQHGKLQKANSRHRLCWSPLSFCPTGSVLSLCTWMWHIYNCEIIVYLYGNTVSYPKCTRTKLIGITLAVCPSFWCLCFLIVVQDLDLFWDWFSLHSSSSIATDDKFMCSRLSFFVGDRPSWGHSLMSMTKKEAIQEGFIWKWLGRTWQNVLEAQGLLLLMTWAHATTLIVIQGLMLLNLSSLHLILQRGYAREGLTRCNLYPYSEFRERKRVLLCPWIRNVIVRYIYLIMQWIVNKYREPSTECLRTQVLLWVCYKTVKTL